jgi:hypothetical protein
VLAGADGADGALPEREAALARLAVGLTARPWAVTGDLAGELAGHGFAAEGIEAAVAIVAMFNYFTRVADASGIEFDYLSPLPVFQPQRSRRPSPRPARADWPVVDGGHRGFPLLPELDGLWRSWRALVLDSDSPLGRRERRVLARAAAEECCDRWQAEQFDRYAPGNATEVALDAFARKLSRCPWQMGPSDLETLRAAGFAEPALLHAIAVVAHQNAASRAAMARAALTG